MVTLSINKILTNRIYRVTFTAAFDDDDNTLIAKYGDPSIYLGSPVSDGVTEYTVDGNFNYSVYLKAVFSLGVTKDFDSATDEQAMQRANAWAATITQRIQVAMQTLRVNYDSFTRNETAIV